MSDANGEQSQDDKEKYVSKQVHDEVMQDLLKRKTRERELEDRLKSFESEQENLKTQSLKEKEDWKKLAEVKEKETLEFKKKLESQEKLTANYFKRAEVRAEAIKSGMREAALDDLDLIGYSGVDLETTSTGKLNVLGADKFVERLKATKPFWFEDKKAPMIDGNTPTTTKGPKMSMSDILKLQKQGKQAEYEAALRNYKKGG